MILFLEGHLAVSGDSLGHHHFMVDQDGAQCQDSPWSKEPSGPQAGRAEAGKPWRGMIPSE